MKTKNVTNYFINILGGLYVSSILFLLLQLVLINLNIMYFCSLIISYFLVFCMVGFRMFFYYVDGLVSSYLSRKNCSFK